ncbi:hypothetical protein LRP30_13250 [Bradyrhizobium sp. C-145]|uniref:hypothetical protein n=1 Tax=Bradyrhizobium sp. C-145 TaxID=574727 RepID=UPI00201B6097|nr:hypothetical protein [Bradyrhizobium sp. C-145]UQR66154.1 hypothetical protein LRP30_13250 [Bradyrhizobium sp. C-145]
MNEPDGHRLAILGRSFQTADTALIPMAHGEPTAPDAIVGIWEADDGTVKLDMAVRRQ